MTEREIFFAALEMATASERGAYLEGVCGRDISLRRNVDELLKEHFSNDSLLARPAVDGEPIGGAESFFSQRRKGAKGSPPFTGAMRGLLDDFFAKP